MNITVEHAMMILEERSSSEDPVIYKGEEYDLIDMLPNPLGYTTLAKDVRITYWDWHGEKIHGTLLGMVRDRLQGC